MRTAGVRVPRPQEPSSGQHRDYETPVRRLQQHQEPISAGYFEDSARRKSLLMTSFRVTFFTTGGGGPMGRIIIGRPAGRDGVRVTVAVDDVTASTRRAIELGGGTAEAASSGSSDVGEWTALIDPHGDRFDIFHGRMRSRPHGRKRSGMHDLGLEQAPGTSPRGWWAPSASAGPRTHPAQQCRCNRSTRTGGRPCVQCGNADDIFRVDPRCIPVVGRVDATRRGVHDGPRRTRPAGRRPLGVP